MCAPIVYIGFVRFYVRLPLFASISPIRQSNPRVDKILGVGMINFDRIDISKVPLVTGC